MKTGRAVGFLCSLKTGIHFAIILKYHVKNLFTWDGKNVSRMPKPKDIEKARHHWTARGSAFGFGETCAEIRYEFRRRSTVWRGRFYRRFGRRTEDVGGPEIERRVEVPAEMSGETDSTSSSLPYTNTIFTARVLLLRRLVNGSLSQRALDFGESLFSDRIKQKYNNAQQNCRGW